MNQDFISQTPLDQITGTDYGQMLKAAIPYLPARSRQILSIYEKAMEFRNTVSIFGKKELLTPDLTAASTADADPMDMLNDIRSFLLRSCQVEAGSACEYDGNGSNGKYHKPAGIQKGGFQ